MAGGGEPTAVMGLEEVGIVVGLGSVAVSVERGVVWETGGGATARAVMGAVGLDSGFSK